MSEENQISQKLRWIILGSLVSLLSMLVVAAVIFLATVRPKDDTIVPRVVGISLSEAMLLLQNSDLTAFITTRFVEDPQYEAGLVLQQKPMAGMYVKVGESVELSVSAGLAITSVDDFVGMKLEDVRTAIVTRYSTLLSIKEPLVYLASDEPEGTIIGQDPVAGTPVNGPITLSLLISRGIKEPARVLTSYEGVALDKAVLLAGQNNLPIIFSIEGDPLEGYPIIAKQNPSAGHELRTNEAVRFTVHPVIGNSEKVLATRTITIPSYTSPIKVELVALGSSGKKELLFSTYQQGVKLVVAYYQDRGTQIVVLANGKEQERFTIE